MVWSPLLSRNVPGDIPRPYCEFRLRQLVNSVDAVQRPTLALAQLPIRCSISKLLPLLLPPCEPPRCREVTVTLLSLPSALTVPVTTARFLPATTTFFVLPSPSLVLDCPPFLCGLRRLARDALALCLGRTPALTSAAGSREVPVRCPKNHCRYRFGCR